MPHVFDAIRASLPMALGIAASPLPVIAILILLVGVLFVAWFDGRYEVVHHSQFLQQLIKEGKVKLDGEEHLIMREEDILGIIED